MQQVLTNSERWPRILCAVIVVLFVVVAVFGLGRSPSARAERMFQYCLGAAHPASAEAIKACRDAAEAVAGKSGN